jgi:anti-sigma regulatory factor (Ser/Thr protein kinase)
LTGRCRVRNPGYASRIETKAAARFPPEPLSAPAARRFVADVVSRWSLDQGETIVLLVSELATNAILHGRTDFEVSIRIVDNSVRVEVRDDNSRAPVAALVPDDATTGRGLLLVQALSYRWGIKHSTGGKSVWFETTHHTVDVRVPAELNGR